MELRHLRYFARVAEELNFRRAAARLHVTRPALSKQIKDLERELGVLLIERNTVSARLTGAGQTFQHDALEILEFVEHATERVRQHDPSPRHLRIGDPGPFSSSIMSTSLKSFRLKYPQVEVSFIARHPREQLDALLAGEMQMVLGLSSKNPAPGKLARKRILRSRFGVALSRSHPLASARQLSPTQLAGEKILCMGDKGRSPHMADIRLLYASVGLKTPRLVKVGSFEGLVTMIASEHGVSLLPLLFSASRPVDMRIVPLVSDCDRVFFDLWATWLARESSPLVRAFVAELQTSDAARHGWQPEHG